MTVLVFNSAERPLHIFHFFIGDHVCPRLRLLNASYMPPNRKPHVLELAYRLFLAVIRTIIKPVIALTRARVITDIIDRGKVGSPEQRSTVAQPEAVRGYPDFPKVYNVGYCPSCVVQ